MRTPQVLASLSALAQESRLAIFRLLVQQGPEGLPAGEIGVKLKLPPATTSFHLKELSAAKLIAARQDGRFIWYRADFESMNGLVAYLTENCCRSSAVCDPSCAPAVVASPIARKRAINSRS